MIITNKSKENAGEVTEELLPEDLYGVVNKASVMEKYEILASRFCWKPSVACGKPLPCSKEKFIELLNSPNVKSICERIAALDPSLEGYSNAKDSLKKQLPIVIFQSCRFKGDGRRCNENAVPSGLGMLDIDHVQNPKVIYDVKIAPKVDSNGIWFVAITPSGQGLRIVFELLENESIVQGQRRIAQVCGLDAYDEAVKDMARASFMMPVENVLLIKNEMFMNNMIHDVPMVCVPEGTRHTTGMDALCRLRREYEKAAEKVVSPLSIPESEKNSMITWNSKKLLESASSKIEDTEGEENNETLLWNYTKMIPPKEIPRLFELCCSKVSNGFKPAMICAMLPVLGTLATKPRYEYKRMDEEHSSEIHSNTFISLIAAKFGKGKSFCKSTLKLLASPLKNEWDKEQQYTEELRLKKNQKDLPVDPKAKIKLLTPDNVSSSALLKTLLDLEGEHLLLHKDELQSVIDNMKKSWGIPNYTYRNAFDNEEYSQRTLSDQSVNGCADINMNCVFAGTIDQVKQFIAGTSNGMMSRILIGLFPDMSFQRKPKSVWYSEEEKGEILYYCKLLQSYGSELIESKEVIKAIDEWEEKTIDKALKTQNYVVDALRVRSAVIGFRAGMIAYLLEGKKDSPMIGQFAAWVAEYCLSTQMFVFGKNIEEEEKKNKMNSYHAPTEVLIHSVWDMVNDEFTKEEFAAAAATYNRGIELSKDAINKRLERAVKEQHRITKIGQNLYRKIC